jgi:[ribosomal protein S5]-alanine N-acetyltransferase
MRPPEIFHTARLSARPVRVSDAPRLFATYAADAEATRYLAWKPYTELPPLEAFLALRERDWQGGNHFVWLLQLRDTETVVGSIGVILDGHKAVFGYVLGKKFWEQGLAAEALRACVDWALAQPEVHRAWAYCDVENTGSLRVMEKAGLTREGVLRRWHVAPTVGPEPRDCFVCAKVK